MVKFKKVGGRYGMHSGSARFKNLEVDQNLYVEGNTWPLGMVRGDVWYVDTNVAASGDGKSWDTAFKTITEGFAALNDGDALMIGAGNYDEAGKITLSGKKDVHIFGMSTGMQWGEGSTCWRDVISTLDLLDINNCQGCEIAGISFVVVTDGNDAINFVTNLSYSINIHHCSFIGDVGAGAVMAYGINAGNTLSADLYVHDCKFFRVKTSAIYKEGQRAVIERNKFILPANGYGISISDQPNGYCIISDNDFFGKSDGDVGIKYASFTQNNYMITRNRFAGVATPVSTAIANTDESFVDNYQSDTTGGIAAADPADTG